MSSESVTDIYHLERFVEAQEGVYGRVREELLGGRKRTHWMWFVFPQVAGLGSSEMAVRYGISGLAEARAYLAHAVLGERLRECTEIVCGLERGSAGEIFGYPDDLKFHSSMTLFARVEGGSGIFLRALERYFAGEMDRGTLARI